MKKETLKILVCPMCRNSLISKPEDENETEIISGNLYCPKCRVYFPIENKIANLLPPNLRDEY
jgi:Uncharacterized conserved protein